MIKISANGKFIIVKTLHLYDSSQAGNFGSVSVYEYDQGIRDWVASKDAIRLNDSEDYTGLNFGQSFHYLLPY